MNENEEEIDEIDELANGVSALGDALKLGRYASDTLRECVIEGDHGRALLILAEHYNELRYMGYSIKLVRE